MLASRLTFAFGCCSKKFFVCMEPLFWRGGGVRILFARYTFKVFIHSESSIYADADVAFSSIKPFFYFFAKVVKKVFHDIL